jgi:hypothetical protein
MKDATKSAMLERHIKALEAFKGKKVEVGWFESDRYMSDKPGETGKSVAEVAKLLEFGGAIQHPGGTPYEEAYSLDAGGFLQGAGVQFVSKAKATSHAKFTKPHVITIPPRPFMRLAARNFMTKRLGLQKRITDKVMKGEISAAQALGQIGLALENEVIKSIKDGKWTPNAPSTIKRKGFDKPLIETGLMWKSVSSKVS